MLVSLTQAGTQLLSSLCCCRCAQGQIPSIQSCRLYGVSLLLISSLRHLCQAHLSGCWTACGFIVMSVVSDTFAVTARFERVPCTRRQRGTTRSSSASGHPCWTSWNGCWTTCSCLICAWTVLQQLQTGLPWLTSEPCPSLVVSVDHLINLVSHTMELDCHSRQLWGSRTFSCHTAQTSASPHWAYLPFGFACAPHEQLLRRARFNTISTAHLSACFLHLFSP